MVKKLLDQGTYDILEFKIDVDYRGRSVIRLVGVGKSQETDIEFEISIRPSVIHGWPVIKEMSEPEPKPKVEKPDVITIKRGPGRPPSTDKNE